MDRVALSVRLPTELHERLTAEAEDRCVSANLLVTRAVERFLDQLPAIDVVMPDDG